MVDIPWRPGHSTVIQDPDRWHIAERLCEFALTLRATLPCLRGLRLVGCGQDQSAKPSSESGPDPFLPPCPAALVLTFRRSASGPCRDRLVSLFVTTRHRPNSVPV